MNRRKIRHLTEIPRHVIETTARIMGPASAAAVAIEEADSHDGQVKFYRSGNTIIVVKELPQA